MRKILLITVLLYASLNSDAQINSINKLYSIHPLSVIDTNPYLSQSLADSIESMLIDTSYLDRLIFLNEKKKMDLIDSLSSEFASRIAKLESEIERSENLEWVSKLTNDLIEVRKTYFKKRKEIEKKFKRSDQALRHLQSKKEWFPVNNAVGAQMLYDAELLNRKVESLSNSLFTFDPSGSQASLYNEVVSDYLKYGRLSIGTLLGQVDISKTLNKDSLRNESAMQRLVGGGGNVVISFGIPIYNSISKDTRTFITFKPSFNSDLPQLGNGVDDFSYHINLGIAGYVYISGLKNDFNIFFHGQYAHLTGNQPFGSNLGASKNSFGMGHISAGITFSQKFKVIFTMYGNSIGDQLDFTNTLTFSITP